LRNSPYEKIVEKYKSVYLLIINNVDISQFPLYWIPSGSSSVVQECLILSWKDFSDIAMIERNFPFVETISKVCLYAVQTFIPDLHWGQLIPVSSAWGFFQRLQYPQNYLMRIHWFLEFIFFFINPFFFCKSVWMFELLS